MKELKNPTPDQVKEIFHDIYNGFFRKFKDAKTDEEFKALLEEVHYLSKKHPFKLSHDMLLELSNIINEYYKEESNEEKS